MNWHINLDQFVSYLINVRNYSNNTVIAYRKDLESFFAFKENCQLKEAKADDVRIWLAHLMESGLKPTSVNRKLSSLSSFFKYLFDKGLVQSNPAQLISGPKKAKRLPIYLQQSETTNIFNQIDVYNLSHFELRDYLIVQILYQTGIRRSELVELKIENINFNTAHLKVFGKGKKERIIPLTDELIAFIKKYLHDSQEIRKNTIYLILTNKGLKTYPKFVYERVKAFFKLYSSKMGISPHKLRHSFATQMLDNGASLLVIKELLGHESIAATQIYTHTDINGLKEVFRNNHPKSKRKKL